MKIAVDAYPLLGRHSSGISNYVRNILFRMAGAASVNSFLLYSLRGPLQAPSAGNMIVRSGVSTEGDSLSSMMNTLWLFSRGIGMMKSDGADIFWGTRQMLPPYMPKRMRKLLVSYDLVWHYYADTMDRYNYLVSKALFRHSLRAADHIITISRASARGLIDIIGIPEERISVIYPAATAYEPMDQAWAAGYIASKYRTRKDYMLTVGTLEPRKNLNTLLRVWDAVRSEGVQLLVAGARGWKDSSVFNDYERFGFREDEVKFLGFVPDEDMNALYSGAIAFLFPSVYEGFGIPPLEAMAAGSPVICSNSSSLPEVCGEAGMLLDPKDEAGWAASVRTVIGDGDLRMRMRQNGIKQASGFSWDASAAQTLDLMRRLVEAR